METQLAALGLHVERLPATTPDTIGPDDIGPLSFEAISERLSPPEMAVSISHFRAWRHMLDHGCPRVLVLEDDMLLSRQLPAFLPAFENMGTSTGLLRVETHLTKLKIHPRAEAGPPGFDFHIPLSFEPGSGAYIISAAYAARILASPQRFHLPLDDILFSLRSPFRDQSSLRVAVPALAVFRLEASSVFNVPESILKSDTNAARMVRVGRPVRKTTAGGLPKIRREIRRFRRQLAGAYPKVWTKLFARTTIVPFADSAVSGPPSAAPPPA